MKDEWTLFKVTNPKSPWHYLISQEDLIVLKLTHEQARKLYRLLTDEFKEADAARLTFDRT